MPANQNPPGSRPGYLALTGGIGGAKLALGLCQLLPPERLTFMVNTGDDFEHLGLHISPDLDTLTYTLAGISNREAGWGRADETWRCLETLETLAGETWFRLGDRDLALHLVRTELLRAGGSLTEATDQIRTRLGLDYRILPMSDQPVRTQVLTSQGALAFQHYFVRDRCRPAVTGFEFAGAESARPNPRLEDALGNCAGIIICPSNPLVSVDPILAVPGFREALKASGAPIVAVSPIVAGATIKGPTAKMLRELGVPVTATAVAEHYQGLIDGFIVDVQDAAILDALPMPGVAAETVMRTLADRRNLAQATLDFVTRLADKSHVGAGPDQAA